MSQENKPLDKKKAIEALWRRGQLSWLLDENQKSLYELFHTSEFKIQTWLLARRSGKTRTLCVMAIEQCIRHPKSIVKFLSPTKRQVERNIRPLMSEVLETCPEDLRPDLKAKDDVYYFANGSEIQMAGSEMGNIDSLRGGASNISIIDEAQDVTNLPYAINSVLLPTTSTTKGKILLAGTPPTSYDHEFIQYIEKAEIEGSIVKRDVYANPRMDKKEIKIQAEAMGGIDSEGFRREFLCEIIKDSTMSVIPEFTEQKAKEIVQVWKRPVFYHPTTSMDLGLKDWTFVLFGYYDFKADKLIIEDELVTKGENMYLLTFGKEILKKEEMLWVDDTTKEVIPVKNRVSDHDLIAINEIRKGTNNRVIFKPADKQDRMAGINFIRNLVKSNKLIINPKCKYLIHHLKNAKWAKNRETFARCSEGSHYDGVPTLVYLSRGIDYNKNPYPVGYGSDLRISDTFDYKKAIGSVNFKTGEIKNEFGEVTGNTTPKSDIYKKMLNISNKSKKEKTNDLLLNRDYNIKKYYK
jgi:hypothetical protein